jgi:hypothetical protein
MSGTRASVEMPARSSEWTSKPVLASIRDVLTPPKRVTEQKPLTRANLKTPRAAAIAGILFSVLLIAVFWLLRISVPADPQEPGSWLHTESNTVALAINLVPFAGIAFLWFIGVLRDRLGEREDRFFATVFFRSGLLFLAKRSGHPRWRARSSFRLLQHRHD